MKSGEWRVESEEWSYSTHILIHRRRRYHNSTLHTSNSTLNTALHPLIVTQIVDEIKKMNTKKERTAVKLSVFALLHALLVGLDHFLERVTRTTS